CGPALCHYQGRAAVGPGHGQHESYSVRCGLPVHKRH
ncbi:hypothetical protein AK812_SmicGene47821, partial [Symbiodinium microadriaticum]